jgi:hypothetical protein
VVTVSQVLATAGLIAGWHARSLDQTGLAQKGGADRAVAVVSVAEVPTGPDGVRPGALPLPPDAIEEALRVNGVAVDKNIQAFRRGRQYVAATSTWSSGVRAAEQDKTPGSTALTEAVARYLYKLMAYKDEYEVARLSLDPSVGAGLDAEPAGSDPVREPVGLQRAEDVVLDPGEGEHHAPGGELGADLLDGVHRGHVDVDVRLDVQHEPAQPGGVRVGGGQRERGQQHGVPADRVELGEERLELAEQRAAGDVHAGDLAELPDDHDDGDAGQVADQDGRGQQVADETEPEQPADDREQADQDGQRGGQFRAVTGPDRGRRRWPAEPRRPA